MAMGAPLLADVSVNGEAISATRIANEAQNHPAPPGKPGLAWRAAARALALREALLHEARAQGLSADPQEIEPGKLETPDEAQIRALLDHAITPQTVDDTALRAIYDANPERFRAPALWEAAHILFPRTDGTAAKDTAVALLETLRTNPERFGALAAEHSACSSRSSGGFLGQIGPGDTVPEFEAVLRALSPGQIAPEPVQTRFGWHLIRLDAAAEGAVLPFETVAPRLRAAAEKAAWVKAAKAYAEEVLARADVSGLPELDKG